MFPLDVAGEGTRSHSQLADLGLGWGQQPPGYLGWEGLQALRRAPVSLWVSLGPSPASPRAPTRNSLEPGGAPDFPWIVGSRPGTFSCTSIGWSEADPEL